MNLTKEITAIEFAHLLDISYSAFKSRLKTPLYKQHCPKIIAYRRKAALYDLDAAIAFKEIIRKTDEATKRKKDIKPVFKYSGDQVMIINFLRQCNASHVGY